MLIVLPPSETKRDGGADARLDLASLRFAKLRPRRAELVRAVRTLARDPSATIAALKLGRTQHDEVIRNRRVTLSPTMPALDRYTGVIFDALDAPTLSSAARAFAGEHLIIQSALFGPIGALDAIPAYRLSHDSRLPSEVLTSGSLKKHWAPLGSRALAGEPGLLLDFRSEGYVALSPVDARPNSYFLRVVTAGDDGAVRALNHFNKHAKGELTRALLESGVDFATIGEIIDWARLSGLDLAQTGEGEISLTV
ncbi:YaaA family protein [Subtercola endophyticus]|uniref:YaaA family protein n=1 Tax=Subtercola endophyticus TaxID=2895559 RepID=UPI001E38DE29|nr:peroxide stress protein YaaA [Subtercola endophyticus]UFS60055.1 peroxide stress protein YaaA [Subtercola endophyticus]